MAGFVAETAYIAGLLAPDGEPHERYAPTPEYDRWLALDTGDRWSALAAALAETTRVAGWIGDARRPRQAARRPRPGPRARGRPRAAPPRPRRAAWPCRSATALDVDGVDRPGGLAPSAAVGPDGPDLVRWTLDEAERLGRHRPRGAVPGRPGALINEGRDAAADVLEPLLPEPLDHVLLQADLTAVAPGPLESSLAAELGADGRRRVDRRRDRLPVHARPRYVVRWTPGAPRTTYAASSPARSRTPVPQPLSYLVDDIARRHGVIRVGIAKSYLRCDDEAVLSEIIADRRSARLLKLRRLAAGVIVARVAPEELLDAACATWATPRLRSPTRVPSSSAAPTCTGPARAAHPLRSAPSRPVRRRCCSTAAVRALRAGDRASEAPRGPVSGPVMGGVLPRTPAAQTLELLRDALERDRPLWIGFVDQDGGVTERVVDPVRLSGGALSAFDHRTGELRTFPVHRITGAALIDEDAPAYGRVRRCDSPPDAAPNRSAVQLRLRPRRRSPGSTPRTPRAPRDRVTGSTPFLSTPSATARKYVARPLAGAFISGGAVASISSANLRTSSVWLLVGNVLSLLNFSLARPGTSRRTPRPTRWRRGLAAVDGLLDVAPPLLLPPPQAVSARRTVSRPAPSRADRFMVGESARPPVPGRGPAYAAGQLSEQWVAAHTLEARDRPG